MYKLILVGKAKDVNFRAQLEETTGHNLVAYWPVGINDNNGGSLMPDEEWQDFLGWWKSQWSMSVPHRLSIELYLKWKFEKDSGKLDV